MLTVLLYAIPIFICLAILWRHFLQKLTYKQISYNEDHILITGGSSGIGFNIAKETLLRGAKVTLFARNYSKLEDAKKELYCITNNNNIYILSVDVSSKVDELKKSVDDAINYHGDITMLINCAGYAMAKEFDKFDESEVKNMFDVNFFGSFYLTQIVSRHMKEKKTKGHILFFSSLAGLFSFYGYSVYSSCKAAVIKAAEAIHMELKPYNISVTVSLPPDTDTPGFEEEQKGKPKECTLISEGGGFYDPQMIAKQALVDCKLGKFYSTVGSVGFLLSTLCANMSPLANIFDLIVEVLLGGFCRLIAAVCLLNYDSIVKNEHKKKLSAKKEN